MIDRSMWHHWAYRPENQGTHAEIRRYLEENKIPGWSVVKIINAGRGYTCVILKFDHIINYKGKRLALFFLEERHSHNGEEYHVARLFSHSEEV